jgi:hypothetical protein
MNCKNCYHKDVCNGRIYAEDSGCKCEDYKDKTLIVELEKIEDNENDLKVGDIVYILGKYTPDGIIRIVEVEIQDTWTNGTVAARTINEPGEWMFYQSHLNIIVFYTREEAEKALKGVNRSSCILRTR